MKAVAIVAVAVLGSVAVAASGLSLETFAVAVASAVANDSVVVASTASLAFSFETFAGQNLVMPEKSVEMKEIQPGIVEVVTDFAY